MENNTLLGLGAIGLFLLSGRSGGNTDNVVITDPSSPSTPSEQLPSIFIDSNEFPGDSLLYSFGLLPFNSAVRIPGTPLINPTHIREVLLGMLPWFDETEIAAIRTMTGEELVILFTYYILYKFNRIKPLIQMQNQVSAINQKYRTTFPLL